jgi:hypothetical protein
MRGGHVCIHLDISNPSVVMQGLRHVAIFLLEASKNKRGNVFGFLSI